MTLNSHKQFRLRNGNHHFSVSCCFVVFNLSPWTLHLCVTRRPAWNKCENMLRECNKFFYWWEICMYKGPQWTAYCKWIINDNDTSLLPVKTIRVIIMQSFICFNDAAQSPSKYARTWMQTFIMYMETKTDGEHARTHSSARSRTNTFTWMQIISKTQIIKRLLFENDACPWQMVLLDLVRTGSHSLWEILNSGIYK